MLQSARPIRIAVSLGLLTLAACAEPTSIPQSDNRSNDLSAAPELRGMQEIAAAPIGHVVVRFRPNSVIGNATTRMSRIRALQGFLQNRGATIHSELPLARTWVVATAPGAEDGLASTLSEDPAVEWAEVDDPIILQPCETGDCLTTNDPFRGYKWDLHNNGRIVNSLGVDLGATGKFDADIDWLEAYDALGAFTGSATIGVVDTGILPSHQDLTGKVVAASNFAALYAANFIADRNSHGTHVAGIAAAHGNNGGGIMGIAYGPNIRLLNAKACEWYNFGPPIGIATSCFNSSIAAAITWAVDNGANVINLSLGGSAASEAIETALKYARSKGVIPFCATGNDGSATVISYPARYAECVAVGATNWADVRASYSNAGDQIDISAPGGDGSSLPFGNSFVLAPVPTLIFGSPAGTVETNVGYGWKSGTSMATPQATGLGALLFATGVTDANQIIARMASTVDDLGASGWDSQFGVGRINVCRALDPAVVRIEAPGSINRQDASAIVPVTLFGGPRFLVAQFDLADLTLSDGSSAATHVALRDGDYRSAVEDVDGDGVMDLSLKFSRKELVANGLGAGMRTMQLTGNVGCRRIKGTQDVRVK
jgi:hypothetical protein